MRKKIIVLLIGLLTFMPFVADGSYSKSSAANYLTAHSENPWSTMGLIALNERAPSSYLKSISGTSAIEYAAPILAITAIGQDPRNYGTTDYVAKLKTYYQAGQIGNVNIINDDVFGLLSLVSAGESTSSEIISSVRSHILSKQNSSGGWGFVPESPDTNMTAAAVVALIASGSSASSVHINKALGYLRSAQNSDGGFPYDPVSPFGNASDSSSTSWVIWALNSVGVSASSWSKGNNNPRTYLESTQHSSGYFEYQKGTGENSFSATNTAYAAIALTGKTLPLRVVAQNSGGSADPEPGKFAFKIQGKNSTVCQGEIAGPTALDIVRNATSICSYTYEIQNTSFGQYLYRINNEVAQGSDGWLYSVNGTTPGVGASEYQLKSGDSVLWFYSAQDQDSPQGISSSVNLTVNIEKEEPVQEEPDIISFTINPSQIDFGTLKAGASSVRNVNITNNGTVAVKLKSNVEGDPVFKNNVKIDGLIWSAFESSLGKNATRGYDLSLTIPSDYSGEGVKPGQIIFWATKQ